MALQDQTITVQALDVQVCCQVHQQPVGGTAAAVQLTAIVGGTVITEVHTLAAVDGAMTAPDPNHVQQRLDDARALIANKAAYQEQIRLQLLNAT